MKQEYISKQRHKHLLLFFTGWGMDTNPFQHYQVSHKDFMICYDYRTPTFNADILYAYQQIKVIGWSMGVWQAGHTLSMFPRLPITQSIAFNGTPYPIDATKGIGPTIFEGTLNGLNENTLHKFRLRMCGSKGQYQTFMQHPPVRCVQELQDELCSIKKEYATSQKANYKWDKAIIGTEDRIFSAKNQLRSWEEQNCPVVVTPSAHYDETIFQMLFCDEL